jgi:hypothetical protein
MKQGPFNKDVANQSRNLCKFKDSFLMRGGLKQLKQTIKLAFDEEYYEIYFYCLGCLPALVFNSYYLFPSGAKIEGVKKYDDMIEEVNWLEYMNMLINHLCELYGSKSSEMRYMTPLLLALRALVGADSSLKSSFLKSQNGLLTLFLIVFQAHSYREFKNLYISGLVLMFELEYDESRAEQEIEATVFKESIDQRLERMRSDLAGLEDDSTRRPRLSEDINQLEQWREELSRSVKLYFSYIKATRNQLDVNIGHDDAEVAQGFDELIRLFDSQRITKSFMVTDFGALERYIISSL